MKALFIALAAIAFSITSAAGADADGGTPAAARAAPRDQTLLADLAAGMRELLRAVAPEISLPALELKLPAFDADRR